MRYGVATGAEAYGWTGTATVKRMAEWPSWMPPADMIKRWPHLKPVVAMGGLPGGPENPLGARALYLYDAKGKDTLYRIHGTNEPTEIGHGASSGCIRMRNIDVIDLSTGPRSAPRSWSSERVSRAVAVRRPAPGAPSVTSSSSGGTPKRTGSARFPEPARHDEVRGRARRCGRRL